MKRAMALSIGALALAGAALPTFAADMPARPIAAPPAVAPTAAFWTGFYLGVGLGGRWTDTDWTTTCLAPLAAGTACPFSTPPLGAAVGPASFGVDNPSQFEKSGFRASTYGGFNWQISNWVLGVEGDWGWADTGETHSGIPGTHTIGFTATNDFATVKDTWDASVRGRLGFLVTPTALFYATGGAAWLHKDISASCAVPSFALGGWCTASFAQAFSATYTGWTVGGGFEWMLVPNWVFRGEYRYSDYGSKAFTFAGASLWPTNRQIMENLWDHLSAS